MYELIVSIVFVDVKELSSGSSSSGICLGQLSANFYSASDRGAEYCDQHVCLSTITSSELHVRCSPNFLCMLPYGRGSVLLWRHSDPLRISGSVDDIIFAHLLRLLKVAARLRQ